MMRAVAFAALLLAAAPAAAELVNENLLVALPDGYKIDHQAKNQNQIISEMVPKAENVNDWTEMVTVQIFLNRKDIAPKQIQDRIVSGWIKACPDGTAHPVAERAENGYAALVWMLTCPKLAATGKPEWTFFKAIRGNDSFYMVQKAFRFEPSEEQVVTWTRYLSKVSVCDSRLKDRACPNAK